MQLAKYPRVSWRVICVFIRYKFQGGVFLSNFVEHSTTSHKLHDLFPHYHQYPMCDVFGVVFEHMSWKPHTSILSNRLSKHARILNKLKHHLPMSTMRALYFSMVGSVLNYGILIWGFAHGRLIKIQKRVIRIITRSKHSAYTEPLFNTHGILQLEDNMKLNAIKFYFKYTHETLRSTCPQKAPVIATIPVSETK